MINHALQFLIEAVFGLALWVVLARFWLQVWRAPFQNPIGQFLMAASDWAVKPLRRQLGGRGGYDWACLLLAWLVAFVLQWLSLQLHPLLGLVAADALLLGAMLLAVVKLAASTVSLVLWACIVQALLSWVNPYTPLAPVLDACTRPFLRPLQQRLPSLGGLDLSPLVLILLCQLVQMLPLAWLEAQIFNGILR